MSQMSGDFMYEQPKASSNTLGLVGFILAFCLSPIGLLLSLIGLGKTPRGFAVAGVIVGLIGTAIWAVVGYGIFVVGSMAMDVKKSADAISAMQASIEGAKSADGMYPADLSGVSGNADIFGNPYEYERSADGKGYLLTAKGKDGQFGTEDDFSTSHAVVSDVNMVMGTVGASGGLFGSKAGPYVRCAGQIMLISIGLQKEKQDGAGLPEKLDQLPGIASSLLTDPWGSPYVYTRDSDGKGYALRSNGPDKTPGTQDDMDSKKVMGDFDKIQSQQGGVGN